MDTHAKPGQTGKPREGMPPAVRGAVVVGAGLVLAVALYLIAVRGDALLVDLQALGQRIWCF